MNTAKQQQNHNGRIPLALQAVILASNRGEEIDTPPPGNAAFRVFQTMFSRGNKKSPASTPDSTKPTSTSTKGFFGRTKGPTKTTRRSSATEVVKEQQPRRSSAVTRELTPIAERSSTAPVMDVSFQTASPTTHLTGSTTSKTESIFVDTSDDISVASSVTMTVIRPTKKKSKKSKKKTPQSYLDDMVKTRGYTKKRCYALECGYHNQTTKTQRLSYHAYVVELVKDGDAETLRKLLSAGISANPANSHGEGLINLACRLGQSEIVRVMIEAGCDVQVSDDYGRTPLHDACCAPQPSFDVVEQLLKADPYLPFVMDVRGSLPLSYVREDDYGKWVNFLQSHEHEIWPFRVGKDRVPPLITLQPPNMRSVPEPKVMLPTTFIEMLASGRVSPEEVTALHDFDGSTDDDSDDSDFSSYDDDDEDEEDDDETDEDEEEEIENFDPENGSIGRISAGGYTFDFSEKSDNDKELGDDNVDNPMNDADIINAFIENLNVVKSTGNKPGHNKFTRTASAADVGKIRSIGKTGSNGTLPTTCETEIHTAASVTMDRRSLGNIARSYSVPRTISAPVQRVPASLMKPKPHFHTSTSHRPMLPTFDPNQMFVAHYPTWNRPGGIIPQKRSANTTTYNNKSHPKEIDLRQHCFWNHNTNHDMFTSERLMPNDNNTITEIDDEISA